ncbi:universal stress protein [Nitrosococcus watsonii]|uniref:UspA domain protein n=1 Tax=Nitrosococcus watsoni (strain C-113) TaxID=105559 RepID=D8K5D4_NITWC|nr:universal stress protein [Nitrosococcus watsonii]ADJ28111.1 UspA domain protein [Nitrosococcus watsonii C-113]
MKEIRNILLALDGKYQRQALIAQVAAVAESRGARVTLLSVLESPPSRQEVGMASSELQQLMTEERAERLQAIASELEQHGVQVTVKVVQGKAFMEIIREALKGKYDLVMKPAESESSVRSMLFGSTDMQLLRMCPAPVWVIKPTHHPQVSKIMIAVDLLPLDEEKTALADTVMQWGKIIARLAGVQLDVLHIWDLYGETTLRGRTVLADTIDNLVRNEEQRHRQWLDESLSKNGLAPEKVRIHFYKGEAKELIPVIANQMETDLLIMGTVGRTGIPGFFIGNTADSVLQQVDCSVLAIKPEGFVTPVKVD